MMAQMWPGASVFILFYAYSSYPRQHSQAAGLLEISLYALKQGSEVYCLSFRAYFHHRLPPLS
ncbi:hypothetical protein GGE65_007424 [Skermanella aerolata]